MAADAIGSDPIRIKMRHWPHAWSELLGAWSATPIPPPRASLARWLYLRRCATERVVRFGVERTRAQPSGRLDDGTLSSFF